MYSVSSERRSRIIACALSAAIIALIFLIMVSMGIVDLERPRHDATMTAVQLDQPREAQPQPAVRAVAHNSPHAVQQVRPPQPQPPQPPPPGTQAPSFIHLSHDEFAGSDISKLGKAQDSGDTAASAAYGPGEGPGGARLYNAAWYREPSSAELSSYILHGAPPGSWATIACRTIEHYHVDDCQELDESPPGSGLSRALRQAAWQFLVRPPRINGQAMIGAWVKIRFDWTSRKASTESSDNDSADGAPAPPDR